MGCVTDVANAGPCGSTSDISPQQRTVNPNWYDPLGPAGMRNGKPVFAPTGGIPLRNAIFNEFGQLAPQFSATADQAAGMMRSAAADPGYASAAALARSEINGDYLNGSPALDSAMGSMRAASNAATANTNARVKSQFQQNGMNFGTGNQQAQENTGVANTATANQAESQARLQNYEQERQIQQQAPEQLNSALSSPINYLAQIPNEYLGPLSQMAQVVAGMAGNGQVHQPDTIVTPSALQSFTSAIGSL